MGRVSRLTFISGLALAAAACMEQPGTGPTALIIASTTPQYEAFTLCKTGSSASFDYSVTNLTTSVTTTGSVSLTDGECTLIATAGGLGANVTVTETSAQTG